MKLFTALVLFFSLVACQTPSIALNKKQHIPENLGFSSQRLGRITPAMEEYITQGKLAGISTLVARNGKIAHFQVQGHQDIAAATPLSKDTIFRIYSMTKPITAVAALTLWEQGKFHMHDPIAKYFPEFKDMQVYVEGSGNNMKTEKAKHPIRIIDLFTHTSGLSYGFSHHEIDKQYRTLFAQAKDKSSQEFLGELAKLPLFHQPGSQYRYSVSIDMIGFLVEKISGKKLGQYMQETIFSPLNMQDTGFYVPNNKVGRFSQVYSANKNGDTQVMEDEPLGDYLSDPSIHNGGGGLVSTMKDYFTFTQMLLNGGEINGHRVLGRKTVEYMRSNHLPSHLLPYEKQAKGQGYGLAVSVTLDPDQVGFMSSEGNYGWSGLASTYFRIDPKENMLIISMAQFIPMGYHAYHNDFRNLVYQALVD